MTITDDQMNSLLVSVAGREEADIAAAVFGVDSILREIIQLIATHPEKLQNSGGQVRAVECVPPVGCTSDEFAESQVFDVEVAVAAGSACDDVDIAHEEFQALSAADDVEQCDTTLYACPHCDKEFIRVFELQRHITCRHTSDKKFVCDICGARFALKIYLSYHVRAKHCPEREKPFVCNQCGYRCIQKSLLIRHMQKHISGKRYKCDQCEAAFPREITLKRHMFSHKSKDLACSRCEFRTADPYRLNAHIKLHDQPERYSCSVCNFKCKEKGRLTRHMDCHVQEKSFPCDKCELIFKRPGNLKRHQYVHTEKNLSCSQCDYRTADPYEIKRHQRVHTEGKKHVCDICQFRFARLYDLKKHRRIHDKTYCCGVCTKSFINSKELGKHRRRRHMNSKAQPSENSDAGQTAVNDCESPTIIYVPAMEDSEPLKGVIVTTDDVIAYETSSDQHLLEIASAIIAQVDEAS